MPGWDGSGSLFALGLRLTKLDATGAPLVGTTTSYVTEALTTVGLGLSYEDGAQITQRNGAGNLCMSYKAPDTLVNGVVDALTVCQPDPNILQFAIGGDTINRAAVAEVQTVTITGTPTGGTFTLTYSGQTTAGIAFNAAAAAVQSALEALSNIEPGDVVVGGGPGPGTPYTVTFLASLGNVVQMSASGAGLTGGTAPAVAVTTTTPGLSALAIGYKAPELGITPNPNGIGLEFWTANIADGAYNSDLPYMHWTAPRATLRLAENFVLNAESALTPVFQGTTAQNANWGAGPEDDWPVSVAGAADRVWQFVRVASLPDLTRGYVTVTA
jgi:hypothetical protein